MTPDDRALRAATACLALRARRFSRLVTRHYERALRETGLTPAQFSLLGAVALHQPLSPSALARMLDLEKSTLSRNLRPLIGSKLLVSGTGEERGRTLRVTARGKALLQRALPAWRTAQAEALARLGESVGPRLDGMIAAMAQR